MRVYVIVHAGYTGHLFIDNIAVRYTLKSRLLAGKLCHKEIK